SPLDSRFQRIEEQLEKVPASTKLDLSPLNSRFQRIEEQLEKVPASTKLDLSPLNSRFQRIEEQLEKVPASTKVDLSPLHNRFQRIEEQLERAPSSAKIDLSPLHNRFQRIEEQLSKAPSTEKVDLSSLEAQVKQIETQLANMSISSADLGTLESRLKSIEAQLTQIPATTTTDLGPLETRLAALESSLPPFGEQLSEVSVKLVDLGDKLTSSKAIESENEYSAEEFSAASIRSERPMLIPSKPPESLGDERRDDGSKNLLKRPAFGAPDDLRLISGVGPVLESMLHNLGIYYFWQIADWAQEDIHFVDSRLTAFRGRIGRDGWVSQAQYIRQHGRPQAKKRQQKNVVLPRSIGNTEPSSDSSTS
ncbi:MAG: hypothetical protein KTR25_15115, partial [Myxococcales bacterium]|nr:hypothetical protein [Myxococcales bacterium]